MFYSFIKSFTKKLEQFEKLGYKTHCGFVQDITDKEWIPGNNQLKDNYEKPYYFVSPANSHLYMNGGIDEAYMRMFKDIEPKVKAKLKNVGKMSLLGRLYLPIGSSFVTEANDNKNYLISSPTMWHPQPVPDTENAYWATKATMKVWPKDGTIFIPPMCCGYGCMKIEKAVEQMDRAIKEEISKECVGQVYINEPNLDEQPNYYENTEFKDIKPEDIVEQNHLDYLVHNNKLKLV